MSTMGFIKNEITLNNNLLVPINFTHSCAIGQTGCGKTTGYIYPNLNNRIKENHSILIYDYKGKEHNSVKYFAKKNNRLNDVVEIGKDWGESINIIKYMNNSDLENMFMNLFGRDVTNSFWSTSSTNVCMAILDLLKTTNKLYLECKKTNITYVDKFIYEDCNYKFELEYTLSNLFNIVKSKEILTDFCRNIKLISTIFKELLNKMMINDKHIKIESSQNSYIKLFCILDTLEQKIIDCTKSLESIVFKKDTKTVNATVDSLIICISAPLMSIVNIKCLNKDSFDLIDNLEKGKIIIINVNSFSKTILSSFNNSIFSELTKRTIRTEIKPISFFIDEAQKIVSRNLELPIDILREAKVELFLAFQNSQLMIEEIGENKFKSIFKNIKKRYLFKNPELFEGYDLSKLENFEYYNEASNSMEVNKAEKLFINDEELYNCEHEYQRFINIHEKYIIDGDFNNLILVYNEAYMNDNKVIIKSKDKCERVIDIYKKEQYDKALVSFCKKAKDLKISLDKNKDFIFDDLSYPSLTVSDIFSMDIGEN